ncbi:AT-rich interactive domain-containing protein [Actinidia chinensis var. chinensis]|uniref:AT-rich interactive domain-containing protein n=1 Tax=Actinidia chinensis var. chinensis TaxID=1590841 RepID=A0A2R6QXR6_ACTCC|nr:AT-rich interactive domain-containing protein [Actinidia chinensis var. chinensis]
MSEVEMEDVNRGGESPVGGQDTESEREEDSPDAAVADDPNSWPGEQDPIENGADKNQNNDKQVPEKEARQIEGLVNAAAEPDHDTAAAIAAAEGDAILNEPVTYSATQHNPFTPNSNAKSEDDSRETSKNWLTESVMEGDDESASPEDQSAFVKELESFYRERAMEFKPPKFYGQPLNLLKLWRAVIRLGGYDRVTGSKLWRQVGESFHPPKTCTTVSWTFRIFYEKALLEYERHKMQSGELQIAVAALPEPLSVENDAGGHQAPGSGRARRDAAARAMQGWHVQRLFGYGEVCEPIIKDKNFTNMPKREKSLKSIGSVKNKRPTEVEHAVKAARTETAKQLVTTVIDVGPPADWVKINVRETKDCFEVYALVPGLLREEVRVQSDPAGRLVITGQPEQHDNPWGITAFKKVVSLPARIDPLQTSAVVSLHGRLFVRVPFEQSNI